MNPFLKGSYFPSSTHLQEVSTVVVTTCVVILTVLIWNKFEADDDKNKSAVCSRCCRRFKRRDKKRQSLVSITGTYSVTKPGSYID
uniref:LITAF domain-containing protein n=1 Tax=Strongyloides papillosus TaxID=174720 RepID=A0A0N5C316_STREA